MKRTVTILIVLALLAAGSFGAYRLWAQGQTAVAPSYEVARVVRANLVSTVNATGTIAPDQEVVLVFKTPGRVAEVLVSEGQEVKAGDLIARLDADDLRIALAQAEAALAIAQAQRAKLQAGPTAEDLAVAQANVESAQANVESAKAAVESAQAAYDNLVKGPSEDQKKTAAATLERARILRDQAQAAYDQVAGMPNVGMLPQSVQLQQATVDYEVALANYRLATAPPTAAQLAAARAQIAQAKAALAQAQAALVTAQANLERLQRGPSAEDLAIAEAQVRQAELGLQQAQLALQNSELRAPIDGVISQLSLKPGELATQAAPAAIITAVDSFHIAVQVDEIDIGKVREGQEVRIALDSAPQAEIVGHVDFIAPTPTRPSNVVSYKVVVAIDRSDHPLRSGLSATANIITEELQNVLVIPNRSVQVDRTSGRTFVEKLVNGQPERIEVQLGARNELQSQVLNGLQEGDQVVIGSSGAFDRVRQSFFGG